METTLYFVIYVGLCGQLTAPNGAPVLIYMPPLCEPMSIFPELRPDDAISTHRGHKRSEQAGLEQLGAACCTPVMPTLQDSNRGQSGVPWVKHGSQHHSWGRLGCCTPARYPQGAITHCPWSSQHPFCSKSTSAQDHRGRWARGLRGPPA